MHISPTVYERVSATGRRVDAKLKYRIDTKVATSGRTIIPFDKINVINSTHLLLRIYQQSDQTRLFTGSSP